MSDRGAVVLALLVLMVVAGCASFGAPAGAAQRGAVFVVDRIETTEGRGVIYVLEGVSADGGLFELWDVPGELLPSDLAAGESIELDPRWVRRVSL